MIKQWTQWISKLYISTNGSLPGYGKEKTVLISVRKANENESISNRQSKLCSQRLRERVQRQALKKNTGGTGSPGKRKTNRINLPSSIHPQREWKSTTIGSTNITLENILAHVKQHARMMNHGGDRTKPPKL